MLLSLNSDQEFLRRTSARFFDEHAPPAELRRLREDPVGYRPDYWRRGAELGWTSLLVAEADGGVAVSDSGLLDLTLVAYEFGRHAAPGPLLSASVAAGALSAAGGHPELLASLLEGSEVVAWCLSEGPPSDGISELALDIAVTGDGLMLHGQKRPVECAGSASHLLVTGRSAEGLTQVIVPTDAPGLSIVPMESVDLTRRFAVVEFDRVRVPMGNALGPVGQAAAAVERQLHQALVILNAEAVGAMQRAFDMTVEWAFDRYSFGRPLASYQALKHRFAHMVTWLQASHAISDEGAQALADGAPEAGDLISAGKAYIGQQGAELLQEAVQLHGGIGVTFEHDLHLFLRRVTLNRTLLGTPQAHLRRLAERIARREDGDDAR